MAVHQKAISAKHAGDFHLEHACHDVVQPCRQTRVVHDVSSCGFLAMRFAGKNRMCPVGRANHITAFEPFLRCFATLLRPEFTLPLSGFAFYISDQGDDALAGCVFSVKGSCR